jgi:hypothetical protein
MNIVSILAFIAAALGAVVVSVLPSLKKENEKLNDEINKKDNLIKSVKHVEKIKSSNSKLSKSDLINKL